MPEPDDDGEKPAESRRQIARRSRRDAGESSARLASVLMQLPAAGLRRLGLDENLLDEVERARRITSMTARRRAERTLAGTLRRHDLDELAARIDNVRHTGSANPQRLHAAERWRERLIEDETAVSAFHAAQPAVDLAELTRRVAEARRERATGKPPGAARALFRLITATLEAADDPDARSG